MKFKIEYQEAVKVFKDYVVKTMNLPANTPIDVVFHGGRILKNKERTNGHVMVDIRSEDSVNETSDKVVINIGNEPQVSPADQKKSTSIMDQIEEDNDLVTDEDDDLDF